MKFLKQLLFTLFTLLIVVGMSSFALSESQFDYLDTNAVKPKFTGVATYISKTSLEEVNDSIAVDLEKSI